MRISRRGVAFIKRWEGFETRAYRDVAEVLTIGYGHTGSEVVDGMEITERDAEALLRCDLAARERTVNDLVCVALNQNEFDALVSFEFNTGGLDRSTSLRRLNNGDRRGAAKALLWWNKARIDGVLREVAGLSRRREAEAALFLTPA